MKSMKPALFGILVLCMVIGSKAGAQQNPPSQKELNQALKKSRKDAKKFQNQIKQINKNTKSANDSWSQTNQQLEQIKNTGTR